MPYRACFFPRYSRQEDRYQAKKSCAAEKVAGNIILLAVPAGKEEAW
jgi:hypothetical protein